MGKYGSEKTHILANFKQWYTDCVKKDTKVEEHLPLEKAGNFAKTLKNRRAWIVLSFNERKRCELR